MHGANPQNHAEAPGGNKNTLKSGGRDIVVFKFKEINHQPSITGSKSSLILQFNAAAILISVFNEKRS